MTTEVRYDLLAATARGFIEATGATTPGGNSPDYDLIRSYAAPDFRIEWAPSLFAKSSPVLGEAKDIEAYCEHIRKMSASLTTWTISIRSVFVDVKLSTIVARVEFGMVPKGSERVCNDIVYFIEVDNSGHRVVRCCEYVDPVASGIIRDQIKAQN